jgi:hypothetical protein
MRRPVVITQIHFLRSVTFAERPLVITSIHREWMILAALFVNVFVIYSVILSHVFPHKESLSSQDSPSLCSTLLFRFVFFAICNFRYCCFYFLRVHCTVKEWGRVEERFGLGRFYYSVDYKFSISAARNQVLSTKRGLSRKIKRSQKLFGIFMSQRGKNISSHEYCGGEPGLLHVHLISLHLPVQTILQVLSIQKMNHVKLGVRYRRHLQQATPSRHASVLQ